MADKKYRVAFIIPAFNEGSVIYDVVSSLQKRTSKSSYIQEIVIIDDGSTDNTSHEAQKTGAKVISHILNTGAGGATLTGLRYAKQKGYDYAVTLDGDGQHDPLDALHCLDHAIRQNADLTIGSRLINTEGMSKTKIIGNKGLSMVTHLLFGIHVTDSQSGLRVYSKRAINKLSWKSGGYEFCSEMLWRAHQLRLNVDEYPVKALYTDYSKSKGQNNWNAVNIVKSLVQRRVAEMFE